MRHLRELYEVSVGQSNLGCGGDLYQKVLTVEIRLFNDGCAARRDALPGAKLDVAHQMRTTSRRHPDHMPLHWYFIRNERLGQSVDLVAPSAEDACRDLSWAMSDCVVIRVGQVYDSSHPPESQEPAAAPLRAKGKSRSGR
jgi:hypothetical protein